jgi:hypothetical protein
MTSSSAAGIFRPLVDVPVAGTSTQGLRAVETIGDGDAQGDGGSPLATVPHAQHRAIAARRHSRLVLESYMGKYGLNPRKHCAGSYQIDSAFEFHHK